MNLLRKIENLYLDKLIYFASKRKGFRLKLRKSLVLLRDGLEKEGIETKEMFATYARYTQGRASKKEMIEANKQFVEIVKGLGVGVLILLPFAPLTIPFVVKLGERLGIDIIPSSFKSKEGEEE
ncbi:hypothetical protein M902_0841 [Bacteriovorax sp. BAL6_X]|uniref:hypothetical protein n=1 Tax=Bacteriovorax sp. BAL6_X TaxID=1201290 RepID=UPI0003866FD4|nr:hypothetical protein [Bacteriovorax sp. BAL6_X]EPZ49403.1 hypothetical protein M902_0841 [Bacteriovorax sp. BAL6_X]